jgi:hypothetical protein
MKLFALLDGVATTGRPQRYCGAGCRRRTEDIAPHAVVFVNRRSGVQSSQPAPHPEPQVQLN